MNVHDGTDVHSEQDEQDEQIRIDLFNEHATEREALPATLRQMICTMYFKNSRRYGRGFFCAYTAQKLHGGRKETERANKFTCDHVIPRGSIRLRETDPRNLQALSHQANKDKDKHVYLHSRVVAAQLELTGLLFPDFRQDFKDVLMLFDSRVKRKAVDPVSVCWPWLWREPEPPFRPIIPGWDNEKSDWVESPAHSLILSEGIRAQNMIEWRKTSNLNPRKISQIWICYERAYECTPEEMVRKAREMS